MRKVELLPTRDCEAGYGPTTVPTRRELFFTMQARTDKKKKNSVKIDKVLEKSTLFVIALLFYDNYSLAGWWIIVL